MRAQQKSGPLYMSAEVQNLPADISSAQKPFDLRNANHDSRTNGVNPYDDRHQVLDIYGQEAERCISKR